ncbi:MAG: hypothetical protein WCF18_07610 [Chthoniobacteraceae bacterium]
MPQIINTKLVPNIPIDVAAPDSSLGIDIDSTAPLKPGVYVFQLEVVDDSGNRSRPTAVKIAVLDDQAPTAVIDAPPSVGFGKPFLLSGKRSIDSGGGNIVRYIWTLIP